MKLRWPDNVRDPLRSMWVLYRVRIIMVGGVAVGMILLATDHNKIWGGLMITQFFGSAIYGFWHTKKTSKLLEGDLREKQVLAGKFLSWTMLAIALLFTTVNISSIADWPPSPWRDIIALPMTLAFVYLMCTSLRNTTRRLHSGKIVLWLRRFHAEPIQGVSFPVILGCACSGQATPVTLQDDAYSHSPDVGVFRSTVLFGVMAATGVTIGALVLLVLCFPSIALHPATTPSVTVIGLAIMLVDTRRRGRRKGVTVVGADVEDELNKLLRDLCENRKLVPNIAGIVVLKIPDEKWQVAVRSVLERSSLVVVDVTNLNSNIAWELSTALAMHPPERIVITARFKQGLSEQDCRESVRAAIEAVVSSELARRFPIFFYPDRVGRNRLFIPPKQIGGGLQRLIQQCLSSSQSQTSPQ